MRSDCAISLWGNPIVIDLEDRAELNAALLPFLLETFNKTSTGDEHYDRIAHNIFESNIPCVNALKELVLSTARAHYPLGNEFALEGHEIVSRDRQFIKSHVDSEEGDLTLQYFVKAPSENKALPINSFGNAAFVLVNPARPAGVFRFDNEPYGEFPVLPQDGLLVMYRSYIPHYQCPYIGDSPMVQVVSNIKVKRMSH